MRSFVFLINFGTVPSAAGVCFFASLYACGHTFGVLSGSEASEVVGRTIIYRVPLPFSLNLTKVEAMAECCATLAVGNLLADIFAGPYLAIVVPLGP